jgi:acetyl esterase/lipase
MLLLHGGGFISGSPLTHRRLAALLSRAVGCPALVPDYRLAPEHPFPAALDDALALWAALAGGSGPVVLAGDSAGGGLVASLLVAARDRGLPLPRAAALLSPWTDLVLDQSPSLQENEGKDHASSRAMLDEAAALYAGGRDRSDPLLSPVGADLRGLPPLLVQSGGIETLRDDGLRLAQAARAAGVDATFELWPGLWHVWHFDAPALPEAVEALERVGAFLARHLR